MECVKFQNCHAMHSLALFDFDQLIISNHHILLERKCIREDESVGGNVKNSIWHMLYNVTAYACVFSGTLSLQEDI